MGSTSAAPQQTSFPPEAQFDDRSAPPLHLIPDPNVLHPEKAPVSQFPSRPAPSQVSAHIYHTAALVIHQPHSHCFPQQPCVSLPNPSGSDSSCLSVLSERSPQDGQEDGVSEQDRLPLPPPSVVLELLRSRQHRAMPRPAEVSGSVMVPSFGSAGPVRPMTLLQNQAQQEQPPVEVDRQEIRRQRDILQALITADRQVNLT